MAVAAPIFDFIIQSELEAHEFASLLFATCWSTPMAVRSNHIALFIDGANLHATARALGFDIDYKRLLKEFEGRGSLLRAFYYTAINEEQEYSSLRPLTDWLSYNGYTVVTKGGERVHRRQRPPQGQGKHGRRACRRCHGARRSN